MEIQIHLKKTFLIQVLQLSLSEKKMEWKVNITYYLQEQ